MQFADDWRMEKCFFTTGEILGRAGLKDVTKGVVLFLCGFSSLCK